MLIIIRECIPALTVLDNCSGVIGGGQEAHAPPSVGNSENFRKFQNFILTAHVRDDVMGLKC